VEALVISALVLVYLFVPFAAFRFVLGAFVPLKEFHADEKEHLTHAVLTLGLMFLLALLLVYHVPIIKDHPYGFADSVQLRESDYKIVLSSLHSDKMFEKYEAQLWDAAPRIEMRQARFFFWYFLSVVAFAALMGAMSRRYGQLSRYAPFRLFADWYLLRHISQWHPLLTSFVFPDKKTLVKADVLMTDNTLYRGDIVAHFVGVDGNLSGLLLANPKRFDRAALLKERDTWGSNRSGAAFWREIPSAKLYLFGDKIINLNLNYEAPTAVPELISKFLARMQRTPFTVSITPPQAAAKGGQKSKK
jgi:hypothetical protein